ncbi:hypothetical protein QN277_008675 [Acacia crassicarpa]|uniref:Apple domain-containing protein n=1 Tax=Acacia crassicarpa TaxID=499986 RepID=A0AAE1IQT8_9FABA|nr:hypothetical protein QN277_008675 [Acacia crassicarpa]
MNPRILRKWNVSDWNSGCTRRVSSSWYNTTMDLEECKRSCLQNFSCKAYSNLDIRGEGSGCLIWLDEMSDMRQFSAGGQDPYVRVSASELVSDHYRDEGHGSIGKKKLVGVAVGSPIFVMSFMLLGLILIIRKSKSQNFGKFCHVQ